MCWKDHLCEFTISTLCYKWHDWGCLLQSRSSDLAIWTTFNPIQQNWHSKFKRISRFAEVKWSTLGNKKNEHKQPKVGDWTGWRQTIGNVHLIIGMASLLRKRAMNERLWKALWVHNVEGVGLKCGFGPLLRVFDGLTQIFYGIYRDVPEVLIGSFSILHR